ncbi:MAG TPA: apolipoprotein N-acyltransferase [Holosporales bacterium]|nr:apolipoprotein N-acyltransferase [Holosporales bacterium]
MVHFLQLSTIKKKTIGKPFFSAFLLGLLSSLSFAPTNNLITLICGFLGFLWLFEERTQTLKQSFLLFFLYMFGYYAGSFYWVSLAIIALGQWYLTPFGIIVHSFLLSAPSCLIVPILYKCKKYKTLYPFIFALCLFINEWLIGHFWFGGFPWALTAYAWNEWGMQLAAYVGVYGVSFITLIWLALLYKPNSIKILTAFMVFMFISVFGHIRYTHTPLAFADTTVRIVHPNIAQKDKHNRERIYQNFYCHQDLSHKQRQTPIHLIVWPEAAIFVAANQHKGWLNALKSIAPDKGYAIIGAPRIDRHNNDPIVYTSAYVLNQHNLIDIYDKVHLVPFGEYLPWRTILSKLGVDKLTDGAHDFTPGKERPLYTLDNIPPFSILICYEILFPAEVLNTVGDEKPEWLLNITNDAWYLNSSGPYQHLHIARWRAVEEGIPIIRCTNKGISCVIDSAGRVLKSLGCNVQGVLDVKLPKPIKDRTFYSKHRWFS